MSKKRKANARDSPESQVAANYDPKGNRIPDLDSSTTLPTQLDTDQESLSSFSAGASDDSDDAHLELDDLGSEEIPSEDEQDDIDDLSKSLRPYRITKDANGNPRFLYDEIDPVYESDDSDAPENANAIGNIPLSFYDSFPHIGYDINGKRVMRPAKGAALDSLLDSIEIPKGWTGLTDPQTGKPLALNEEELDVLRRLTRNEAPGDGFDPYPDMIEYFSGRTEAMPLSAAPEPKRRFVPSKHEAKRVMKMVRAIREGRIQPFKEPSAEEQDEDLEVWRYDVWADEAPRADHLMNMPAPKLPPPGYDESYHPPPEYLPDDQEREAWQQTEEEDRTKEFLPADHDALRKVPGYAKLIKEKFERCLDLYLAPRVRRSKLNIDPESLLPKLPSPDDLRPFPHKQSLVFKGHSGIVRSVAISPNGAVLASAGDDGTVRLWSLETGYQIWSCKLSSHDAIQVVRWRPNKDSYLLAAAAGEHIFLIAPEVALGIDASATTTKSAQELLNAGWTAQATSTNGESTAKPAGKWQRPEAQLRDRGVLVQVTVRSPVKVISWHRRGEHFATVSPQGQRSALAIHTLSKHLSQLPLRHLKGFTQHVQFHPTKPILFVASQRTIRSYDLAKQELLKVLQPGARWISTFDVHPGGDNLLVGSFDKRLLWMDLDLSATPYKTFRFHARGIRAARFHQGGLPLFADASDDGSIQVFHGKVVGDLMENAAIVPLTVLRGHTVTGSLGVMDLDWHPETACCVSAGADGTCRLWAP